MAGRQKKIGPTSGSPANSPTIFTQALFGLLGRPLAAAACSATNAEMSRLSGAITSASRFVNPASSDSIRLEWVTIGCR